jgi:2-hydroxycyclohexanecarboxyl-CoA dehydrogenase
MSEILSMTGKVVLVTGAGQNVGRQIALHMADHGAAGVVVNDYFLDRAQAVADEINAAGGNAIALQADVSSHDSVKALFGKAVEKYGRVDVLVNNAGNAGATPDESVRKPFYETGPDAWRAWIGVNFDGVINCTALALPGMIERKYGKIVTIISDASRFGDAGLEIYAAAKAGAAGFMRSVARGMGRHNINANNVVIAAIGTPMIEERLAADPDRSKRMLEKYVIRRLGKPSDVANMVLYLSSGASDYITGQTYPVNGGFTFAL